MKVKFCFGKKNIKCMILLFILSFIVLLCISKSYATTIDNSNISINIDANGVCNIEEMLYVTAIEEKSAYTWSDSQYPSMQLTRGDNIENLHIDNLTLSDYNKKWKNYFPVTYTNNAFSLFYPISRKVPIRIILCEENEYNFL